jgi:hypothetical protein
METGLASNFYQTDRCKPPKRKSKSAGGDGHEKEWTLEELWNEGHKMELLHKELFEFFERTGLRASIEHLMQEDEPPIIE